MREEGMSCQWDPPTYMTVSSFNYCYSLSQMILPLNKTAETLLVWEPISDSEENPPKAKTLASCKALGLEAYFIVWEWFDTAGQALWSKEDSNPLWAGWNVSNLMPSQIRQLGHPVLHITVFPRCLGSLTKWIWASKAVKVKPALLQQPDFVLFSQPWCLARSGEV